MLSRRRSRLLFRWAGRLERLAHWLRGGRDCSWDVLLVGDVGCPCYRAGYEDAQQTVNEWWDPADRP